MSTRTATALCILILALVGVSAFVSNSESREDFLIRLQVEELAVDGPDLRGPDVVPPELDPPRVDGPDLDAPALDLLEILVVLGLAVVAVLVLVALVTFLRRLMASRRGRTRTRTTIETQAPPITPATAGDPGWAAFERFLYELLRDVDPARAIRVAMRYTEAGLGRMEPRNAGETPNEWLRRITAAHPDLLAALTTMVSSYNLVRFAAHQATPADRDTMVHALRTLARSACNQAPPQPPSVLSVP